MLCTMPSNSELRTRLMRAARGFGEIWRYDETALAILELDDTANLLLALCSSHW